MKTKFECFILILIWGGAVYGLVLDYRIAAMMTLLFALVLFLIILPWLKKVKLSELKFEEMNQLMHNLIIQLGATPALFNSLANLKPYLSTTLNELLVESNTLEDYLQIIETHYNTPILKRFLKALSVYDQQGGDFMALTELIVADVLYSKYWMAKLKTTKLNKLFNLISLWGLSFIVLVYLRVGLKVYYVALMKQSFIYVIMIVLLGFIYSLIIAVQNYAQLAKEG